MDVLPFFTDALFLSTVAGVVTPFIHWFLREQGVNFSPRVNFLVNVGISGLAFLPLVELFASGPVDPGTFWAAFGASVGASQATYRLLVKGMESPAVSGDATVVTKTDI